MQLADTRNAVAALLGRNPQVQPSGGPAATWQPHEVRLRAIESAMDEHIRCEVAPSWCRKHAPGAWARRMDRGPSGEQVPVYSFADPDEAFHFKLHFY